MCRFKSCSYRQEPGSPGKRSLLAGVEGSVGHLESPSRSKRGVPSGLARSTRAATARNCAAAMNIGEVRHVASRFRLKRGVPSGLARSTRALSASLWVCWGNWSPYRAVNPELLRALRVRILPHPPAFACPTGFGSAGHLDGEGCCAVASAEAGNYQMRGRSLMGESSRLSIEQMPVQIRSAAPQTSHAVGQWSGQRAFNARMPVRIWPA